MEELLKVLKELNSTFEKIVKPITETIEKFEKLDKDVKAVSKNTLAFQENLENLKNGFDDIQSAARQTQDILVQVGTKVSNAFSPIANLIGDKITRNIKAAKLGLVTFATVATLNFSVASAHIKGYADTIKSKYISALTILEYRLDKIGILPIFNKIGNAFSSATSFIGGIANEIKEKIGTKILAVKKGIVTLATVATLNFGIASASIRSFTDSIKSKYIKTLTLLEYGFQKIGNSPIFKNLASGINKVFGASIGFAKVGFSVLGNVITKSLTAPFRITKNLVERYGAFKKKFDEFKKKYTLPSLNFKGLKTKFKSAYDSVSKFVKKFGDKKKLANLNKLYKTEFSRITSVFKPVANKIISFATEFVKGFKAISKAAEPIISAIVNLAGTIGGFLRAMFGIKEGTSAAAGAINIFKKVLDFLVTPISYITLGLSTLFEVLKPAAPIIGAVAGAWLVWNVIMALSPITWIVLGIVALISVIAVVIKYTKGWATAWQGFKDILSAVWSQLKENFGFFIDSIVYGFQKAWYNVVDFGQRAIQYVKNVGAAIKLAWNGDFSGARDKLNEKITTEAEVKLKKIEEERQQRVQQFNQNTTANALKALNGARKMSSLSFDAKGLKADLKKMQKGFKFPDKAPAGTAGGNTTTNKGITNITDGGKKQTHINIHFDRLVENMVIQSENLDEGVNDMEDKLITSLLRVLNSANQIQTTTA